MPTSLTTRTRFPTLYHGIMDPPLGSGREHRISCLTSRKPSCNRASGPRNVKFSKAASPTLARPAGTQGAPPTTACGEGATEVLVDKPPGTAASRHVPRLRVVSAEDKNVTEPAEYDIPRSACPLNGLCSPDPAFWPASAKVRKGADSDRFGGCAAVLDTPGPQRLRLSTARPAPRW